MNCKIGDLAFIIKSPEFPENIGKIVKVEEKGACVDSQYGKDWWKCTCDSPLSGINHGKIGALPAGVRFLAPDDFLKPIKGEDSNDLTIFKELENV